ncbi:hypothetical protein HMPREF9089_00065 [Eubacterium brachy ATCC 33089]|nr:hypothetical protein HMPREF9089_00065 [Eubacterium brachy ATCC 33089]
MAIRDFKVDEFFVQYADMYSENKWVNRRLLTRNNNRESRL